MGIRKILSAFDISAMGMRVQRKKMDAIASNLANLETTRTESGEPYRRKVVTVEQGDKARTFRQVLSRANAKLHITNPKHMQGVHEIGTYEDAGAPVEARVEEVQNNAFRTVYDPEHPDSDAEGYVRVPNVNLVGEMVDMIVASRAYEANATVLEANKSMAKKALEI